MRQIWLFGLGTAVVMTALMWLGADVLVRLVSGSSEPVVLENGARYLCWTAPFYSVLGCCWPPATPCRAWGRRSCP